MLLAHNSVIAEVESSVILSLKAFEAGHPAQVCLNSSIYGGQEVDLLARQDDLEDLRGKVIDACQRLHPPTSRPQPASPSKALAVDTLFEELRRDVKAGKQRGVRTSAVAIDAAVEQAATNAAACLPGLPAPASSAVDTTKRAKTAAVSLCRVLHLAKDITLDNCIGKSTFWGPFAGSGPIIIRLALEWAEDRRLAASDDGRHIAAHYGGMVDVWPLTAFHPDALLPRMARFIAELADLLVRDLLVAHSAKVNVLLKDGAFSRGKSALLDRFAGAAASPTSPTSDKLWEGLPAKRFILCAGDVSLVRSGSHHDVPAMATPDFGVVKYEPAFRVGYLRLARLLALKHLALRAAIQAAKAKADSSSGRAAVKLCNDLCEQTGLAAAITTARKALSRQLSLVGSMRNLKRYASEGPLSLRTQEQRKTLGSNLAAWNREAAVLVPADQDADAILSPMRAALVEGLDLNDDDDDVDAALLDELRAARLLPKVSVCGDLRLLDLLADRVYTGHRHRGRLVRLVPRPTRRQGRKALCLWVLDRPVRGGESLRREWERQHVSLIVLTLHRRGSSEFQGILKIKRASSEAVTAATRTLSTPSLPPPTSVPGSSPATRTATPRTDSSSSTAADVASTPSSSR